MKKTVLFIISLTLVLSLLAATGCSKKDDGASSENTTVVDGSTSSQAEESKDTITTEGDTSVTDGETKDTPTEDVDISEQIKPEETDEVSDYEFSNAEMLIDHPLDELIALIGEPNDRSYASSCMGSGEDGELYYTGFTVVTYREGSNETVVDVYKD